MSMMDGQRRPRPPETSDEVPTLLGFLEFQRATFEWKCSGLDVEGLNAAVAPSTMTLGGMMKHLARVEEYWFSGWLWDRDWSAPWDAVDFDAEPEWEWRSAVRDTPEELWALWRRFVEQSRANVAAALAEGDLGQLARRRRHGEQPNLRWIVGHMIEEYARHNGHADYLREAVDGRTGE